MLWKMGTKISPPTPRKNTMCRSCDVSSSTTTSVLLSGIARLPLSLRCKSNAGTIIATSDGMNSSVMTPPAVTVPSFHSIMVVTSPMGEKAPPALAAMTISAA